MIIRVRGLGGSACGPSERECASESEVGWGPTSIERRCSGARELGSSGARGSGARELGSSGARELGSSGARGLGGSGARELGGSGLGSSGARELGGSGAHAGCGSTAVICRVEVSAETSRAAPTLISALLVSLPSATDTKELWQTGTLSDLLPPQRRRGRQRLELVDEPCRPICSEMRRVGWESCPSWRAGCGRLARCLDIWPCGPCRTATRSGDS